MAKDLVPQGGLFGQELVVSPDADFDAFWAAYPNKKSKPKAKKKFETICKKTAPAVIMAGLERAKQYDHRFRDKKWTPHPTTWLNAEGWTDEHDTGPDSPEPTRQQRDFESTIGAFDLADQISASRNLRKLGG